MQQTTENWQAQLAAAANPEKAEILSRFFKTGEGEYGHGDRFIGLSVPANRAISRKYALAPLDAIGAMVKHPIHEYRLGGFLALVARYRKHPEETTNFYLDNLTRANNWDLVDLSAPKILGEYVCQSGQTDLLETLSHSENLWEQRIAIVSTFTLLKNGITLPTVSIATRYLTHTHDLIHKATGWMLREMGKRGNEPLLLQFLDRHAAVMPRTMLRYAIEKLPAPLRKHYLDLKSTVK